MLKQHTRRLPPQSYLLEPSVPLPRPHSCGAVQAPPAIAHGTPVTFDRPLASLPAPGGIDGSEGGTLPVLLPQALADSARVSRASIIRWPRRRRNAASMIASANVHSSAAAI